MFYLPYFVSLKFGLMITLPTVAFRQAPVSAFLHCFPFLVFMASVPSLSIVAAAIN